jgi:hypothetical protein
MSLRSFDVTVEEKASDTEDTPVRCKQADDGRVRDLMISYTAESCSLAERFVMESLCLSCAECLATLPIVLRLSRSPLEKEEERALSALYPIGLKAARTARRLSKPGRPGVEQTYL